MKYSKTVLITLLGVIAFILLISLSPNKVSTIYVKVPVEVPVIDTVVITETVTVIPEIHELKGTHYNAVVEQCNADPLTTADMSHIDLDKLNSGELRWVALSRDMLDRWGGPFNYGDTIYVHHDKPELRGMWLVHDTMNARYNKRIDFLMPIGNKIPGYSRCILISKEPFVIERLKSLL